MKKQICYFVATTYIFLSMTLTGCSQEIPDARSSNNETPSVSVIGESDSETPGNSFEPASDPSVVDQSGPSSRDNTPLCLVPLADGILETHNDVASIDFSHSDQGYVCANYTGTCPKVKLRITGPDEIVYTYDLHGNGYEAFPLSSGDGAYSITIYENISGTSYSTCLHEEISVLIADEFSPFLYPNQYVNFNENSLTVKQGAVLAASAENDLEVVANIYDYITSTIIYDYDKASDPPTGYTTDIDEILQSGTGICLDYAAVMASMLRSQRIPTRLEVGYAQDAYHAWISIYIKDIGWLNGIIEFNGQKWTLVDPTFGASTDDRTLRKFIGDGTNYILQKMY